MLPSALSTASASANSKFSGLNGPPDTIVVYLVRPPADRPGAGFGFGLRQRGDACVMGGFVAGRVGRRGVAGERQRLAAAAAPVDLAPLARAAGLLHPIRAAKGAEGRAVAPDL